MKCHACYCQLTEDNREYNAKIYTGDPRQPLAPICDQCWDDMGEDDPSDFIECPQCGDNAYRDYDDTHFFCSSCCEEFYGSKEDYEIEDDGYNEDRERIEFFNFTF